MQYGKYLHFIVLVKRSFNKNMNVPFNILGYYHLYWASISTTALKFPALSFNRGIAIAILSPLKPISSSSRTCLPYNFATSFAIPISMPYPSILVAISATSSSDSRSLASRSSSANSFSIFCSSLAAILSHSLLIIKGSSLPFAPPSSPPADWNLTISTMKDKPPPCFRLFSSRICFKVFQLSSLAKLVFFFPGSATASLNQYSSSGGGRTLGKYSDLNISVSTQSKIRPY
mmetsp:Transcript_1289/g.1535  ORF Transcript_1289/g.1535 Transcript_1289/m.1535 type:complete len:231 (+) Transcript_1289:1437-2129(+)